MLSGFAARFVFPSVTVAGLFVGVAAGQEATEGTSPPVQEAVPRAGADWAEQMFSERSHDFGSVARGADVRHKIQVKNLYEETIRISNVGTTCGCTAAKPDREELKTGEVANIEVVMNTVKFLRDKNSNVDVTLTFDGRTFKTVRIPIHAYIRPDVVLEPGRADFGSIEVGQGGEKRIQIAYAGREDWAITEVKSANPLITTELVPTGRENGRVSYELVVKLAPNAPTGDIRDHLVLMTNDERSPEVDVAVEGAVVADIVVNPSDIVLGTLQAGVPKTVSVVVRGRRPFVIERMECESQRDCYKVRIGEDTRTVHVLPLTITPPSEPGDLAEKFYLTIQGREEPVEFTAHGTIAGAAETAAQAQ
jgi:hypothetical protein